MSLLSDSPENRSTIIRLANDGGVVVVPTDTVYGLATPITSQAGAKRISQIKDRTSGTGIPLLVNSMKQVDSLTIDGSDMARALAEIYWPGQLTLILNARKEISDDFTNGSTLAVRWPNHPIPLAIIDGCNVPITGTSANLHGMPEPISGIDVQNQLGTLVDAVLDGGRLPSKKPSTILDLTTNPFTMVREGAISSKEISKYCRIKAL